MPKCIIFGHHFSSRSLFQFKHCLGKQHIRFVGLAATFALFGEKQWKRVGPRKKSGPAQGLIFLIDFFKLKIVFIFIKIRKTVLQTRIICKNIKYVKIILKIF